MTSNNANDAIITLVNYLETAQSRGVFTLREAREISNNIDILAQPVQMPEEQKSQNSEEADLIEEEK